MYEIERPTIKKRKLKGKWTVDPSPKLEIMYGLDVIEELTKTIAKDIQNGT